MPAKEKIETNGAILPLSNNKVRLWSAINSLDMITHQLLHSKRLWGCNSEAFDTCGTDRRLWICIWWLWNSIENLSIDPGNSYEAECRSYTEYTVIILNNHPRFCSIKWEWDLPWSVPEHDWWSPLWIWFGLQLALAEPQVELVDDPAVPHRKKNLRKYLNMRPNLVT